MTKTYATIDTETGKLISVSTHAPDEVSRSRILTKLAFMRRLHPDEIVAIYALEDSQPLVKVWLEMFRLADEINLDDPNIQTGINTFESMGVLASGRVVEILS